MKKIDQQVNDLIPISESVRILEEQFPWLAGLKWNSKSDDENEEGIENNGENSKPSDTPGKPGKRRRNQAHR